MCDASASPYVVAVPLPYPMNALEPFLSAETVKSHYELHGRTYGIVEPELLLGFPASDLYSLRITSLPRLIESYILLDFPMT